MLVPTAVALAPNLPLTTRPVVLPTWYATRGAALPPGRVVLAYPVPFSGLQSSEAWQAVTTMRWAQAGGGGPQGQPSRAGAARPGFEVLSAASLPLGPAPDPTPAAVADVRRALALWRVTTVVVPDQPGLPVYEQGRSTPYAVGFWTSVLGTAPTFDHAAWVWGTVRTAPAPVPVWGAAFARCTAGTPRRRRRLRPRHRGPGAGCLRRWSRRLGRRGASARALGAAGAAYLGLALVVWWGVWSSHPTSTTTCGCGDSALFLWFFAWPAHALAHGLDPLYSSAMSHPGGVNLLANTSELALGVVLAPVTWVFGPVASMNVALTLAPALSALAMYFTVRRWVAWAPAAFAAGLVYGFSPLVLVSLSDAHLMLGWSVVPPLVVACVDELLSGRRGPVVVGLVLGLLLVVQFFVGTEVLLLLGIAGVLGGLILLAHGLAHRDELAAVARRVGVGLGTAAATAGVLLAWPTWFALAGPAHTSGRVWPTLELGTEGTTLHAYLWPTPASAGFTLFTHRVGGYQGPTLSGQYVGIGMVAVAVAGLLVWRRDRRLWFFGAMTVVSVVLSLGVSRTVWLPWQLVADRPLLENIIPSRFLVVTYLSLAVMLGIVVDRTRSAVRERVGPGGGAFARWAPPLSGLAVALVALGPVADYLAPTVPMVTRPVRPPAWFTEVAPRLPAHRVLLVFPVPYQVIESAMAWQAVVGLPLRHGGRRRTGRGDPACRGRTGGRRRHRPGLLLLHQPGPPARGRGRHPARAVRLGGDRGGPARRSGPSRLRPGDLGAVHRRLRDRRRRAGPGTPGRVVGVGRRGRRDARGAGADTGRPGPVRGARRRRYDGRRRADSRLRPGPGLTGADW